LLFIIYVLKNYEFYEKKNYNHLIKKTLLNTLQRVALISYDFSLLYSNYANQMKKHYLALKFKNRIYTSIILSKYKTKQEGKNGKNFGSQKEAKTQRLSKSQI